MAAIMRTVVISAERFFSHRRVHDLLEAWGEQLRVYDGSVPEAWGWKSSSSFPSVRASGVGHGGMSMPEASVQRLQHLSANVETIHRLIQDLPLIPHYSLHLRYVHQLEKPAIAIQIGTTEHGVDRGLAAGHQAVRRGLVALRENIRVRERE